MTHTNRPVLINIFINLFLLLMLPLLITPQSMDNLNTLAEKYIFNKRFNDIYLKKIHFVPLFLGSRRSKKDVLIFTYCDKYVAFF